MEGSANEEQKKDMTGKDTTTWDSEAACGLLYRGSDCCFNSCTYTSDHYHCQVCGIIMTEAAQAVAHVRASPACRKDPTMNYSASSVGMASDPTNSLYNAIYNGFSAQNSYPSAGFSGFGQLDSFQWHPSMSEKVAICSTQLSPCCSSNGGTYIPVESQLCSPISDLYSKVTPMRDLVSLPAKSSGSAMDSQAWYAAYNPQQMQKAAFKYPEQNPPQINFILIDPSDQKHQDVTEANSNFFGKSDLNGKDVLKESYCAYASQPLPGILSEDALFSLQLQDETLKPPDVQQTSVAQMLLADDNDHGKSSSQVDDTVSSPRVESHFTQEHFGQYMPSCSAYNQSLDRENQVRSAETSNQPSSAASDSDESDIIVEDTGDDLGSQMTESEIFIEDIKCSLLQGVVSEEENHSPRCPGAFRNKDIRGLDHTGKEPKESVVREELKMESQSQMKSCISSIPYHTILKCVMCEKSVSDGHPGSVFVQMNNQMPLTTSSQTPVLTKLNEVVAIEVTDFLDVNGKFMCQSCFNLVDTVDSLESKLESLKQDIAAKIKVGYKPLIVRHNQCTKLPLDLMEENHSSIMNIHSRAKSPSVAVCVQDVQELFQDSLVENPSITRPHNVHDQSNGQKMMGETEQKEYLLLSGRALSLANSINKVSLSLDQNCESHLMSRGNTSSQTVVNEETCIIPKIPEVSPLYQVSPSSSSLKEREAVGSHFESCSLGRTSTLDNRDDVNSTCLGISKSAVVYHSYEKNILEPTSRNKTEGQEYRSCEKAESEKRQEKVVTKESLEKRNGLELPFILHLKDQHAGAQGPHSSECVEENCHEILRSEKKIHETLHLEQNNGEQLKFKCNICGEFFILNEHLNHHLSLYPKAEPALCELCGQLNHNQAQLDDHMFYAHLVYQKHCEVCGERFFHPCLYQVHLRDHSGEKNSLPQKCTSELKTGSLGTQRSETSHVCYKCGKTFQLRSHLEHHIKTTHVLKKALSKCDKCEKTFIKPSDLEAHKRSHSLQKNFECKVCGRRYKSLGNLNHHAKSHEVKKPYTCKICSQGFIRKDFFETHLNSHKDNKPFKCEKCQKGFLSKSYLQVHIKWHLDKIKKVTCPICKKTFSQRLNVHMRSHTGERPHPCDKCPKKFITGSALRKHVKRIHRPDSPTEDVYTASSGSEEDLSDLDEPKPIPCSADSSGNRE